jgi:16S rRNA (cytidine1402-2'-O)-methyltransferase
MKLYLIPTPIGNLEDITLRALRILKEVDIILAEDTRTSSKLLKHYEIDKKVFAHHQFNEHKTTESLVRQISGGTTMALISDAGTPGISDPGFLLTRACIQAGIAVECLPGPTAFVPALVNSGLPSDRFLFEGFLPHKKGRQTRLKELAKQPYTFILYESPFRLVKSLEQLAEYLGTERQACVSRELTKIYEENRRGTLAELAQWYKEHLPKGEIVIVVAGSTGYKPEIADTEENEEE